MRCRLLRTFLLLMLALAGSASAQMPASRLQSAAAIAVDLTFPVEPSKFSFFSTPRMSLYKPDGTGPFPALILLHACSGLSSAARRFSNTPMLNWAKVAVKRGYVAMLVDSLEPRGVDSVCDAPRGGVNFPRGVKDALQAAEHLRKFTFIDKSRVALAGFSWGATIGVAAASRTWSEALLPGQRLDAAIAFYPKCSTARSATGAAYELVSDDIDRPLLVMMGERDNETPPDECVSRLRPLKGAGAPVEWRVYPDTTHCWDCDHLHGQRKTDLQGNSIVYLYDRRVTEDSLERMFAFLEGNMPFKK